MTTRDYDSEIVDLEKRLANVRVAKAQFEALTPEQKLADLLHQRLCRHNHADACGYLYESWEQVGDARSRELRRANRVLRLLNDDYSLAEQLVRALEDK